jgi:diaminohydroxyphosphoribosylaminopyrimidine deaminase/5-amino-6-(5-phosphoribosylamino)uracil reductase
MGVALELAARAKGMTWPNPMVGAVIVRNGEVVGRGYHQKAGLPHAEIEALSEAGDRSRGSALYVTLEPCCHQGRTPPCTGAIIEAGITRVVYAMRDPNVKVNGNGRSALTAAGIEVTEKIMEQEAKQLNEVYSKYMTTGLPFTTLKLAMSLDGRIAVANGESRGLSGGESQQVVHAMRLEHEAILVGAGTVLKDDPQLTVRLVGNPDRKQPTRFILDSTLAVPLSARVFDQSLAKTVVVTTGAADQGKKAELEKREIEVWVAKTGDAGMIDLAALLHTMGLHEYVNLMVEGGSRVAASFLKAGLVDKAAFFYAPKLIGGDGVPAIGELDIRGLDQSILFTDLRIRMVGQDILAESYVIRTGTA